MLLGGNQAQKEQFVLFVVRPCVDRHVGSCGSLHVDRYSASP